MRYYITIEESLAKKLEQVADEDIIEVLRNLAEKEVESSDELAAYDSVTEIMSDETLSDVEKRQLKLKAERRSDIYVR